MVVRFMCCVFFFKQKTAYDMRISDWSSDVCSSDLLAIGTLQPPDGEVAPGHILEVVDEQGIDQSPTGRADCGHCLRGSLFRDLDAEPLGRSEERRVGKECVRTGRSWWSRYH